MDAKHSLSSYRCPGCHRIGTLVLVQHPAGDVAVCRRCSTVRAVARLVTVAS